MHTFSVLVCVCVITEDTIHATTLGLNDDKGRSSTQAYFQKLRVFRGPRDSTPAPFPVLARPHK